MGMMQMTIDRLNEASTWRGMIAMFTACGVAVSPSQQETILACGLTVMGLLGVFIPDVKSEKLIKKEV